MRAVVTEIIEETPSIKTLVLRVEGSLRAKPGQFNMLYYWGIGEIPVSIASIPIVMNGYTIIEHTVKATGAVSRALVYSLGKGDIIGLRGPYGRGWPIDAGLGMDILIIAGGIGIAPLRPLVRYILEHRRDYGRLLLLYGARTPRDIIYREEIEYYMKNHDIEVYLSSDTSSSEWRHHVGFVTDLLDTVRISPENTIAFICGPEAMMKTAVKKLLSRGLKSNQLYLSLERRMRCGVGVCGTCQFGHFFVCRDGPVFRLDEIDEYFWINGV